LSLNSSPTTSPMKCIWISYNQVMISSSKLDCTTYHTTILWTIAMINRMSLFLFSINQMIPTNFLAYRKKIKKSNFSDPQRRVKTSLLIENPKKKQWKSKKLITMMILQNLQDSKNSWSQRINRLFNY